MTFNDMMRHARLHQACGLKTTTLWMPSDWKAPAGFPRRELLCCPSTGGKTWTMSTARLIKWLESVE